MIFTAPKDYTEAKTLMGKTIETPIGALECRSAGYSGSTINLSFGQIETRKNHFAAVVIWTSDRGWETHAEGKSRTWNEGWAKLPANAQKLVNLILGDALADIPTERRSNAPKLLRIAKRRLIKAG